MDGPSNRAAEPVDALAETELHLAGIVGADASRRDRITTVLNGHADSLKSALRGMRRKAYPPNAAKSLRTFSLAEAAQFAGAGPDVVQAALDALLAPAGASEAKRGYSLAEINAVRARLDERSRDGRRHVAHRREGEHLQVLCVANFKGGSGKTTTASHLAQYLALRGYRVLALDLDPQASMTALHGIQPELDVPEDGSLYRALAYGDVRRPLGELVQKTYFDGLDIVPGNIDIQDFEHEVAWEILARKTGKGSARETPFFLRLREAIDQVAADYDVVVVDCPPQIGYLAMAALAAATALIIPVHPAMVDVMSLSQFCNMTAGYMSVVEKAGISTKVDFIRYLITRYEPGDAPQKQMASALRKLFGSYVLDASMLKTTALSDANVTKRTIYEVPKEKFSRSTYDRAMESLSAVNAEIESYVSAAWGRMA